MSDDTLNDVELTRTDWSYAAGAHQVDEPRRFDNPLMRGLVVLVMLAVATTVIATTDEDDSTVVASGELESQPLAPEVEPAPATSIQEVASETAGTDDDEGDWTDDVSAFSQSIAAEQLRLGALRDNTTTTAPPTTVAPTTAAPATNPPTSAPPATESTTTETLAAGDADMTVDGTETTDTTVEGTETTDTTVDGGDTTTVPAETTTTAPAETTTTVAAGDGWVDAGHGVLVPPVLLAIRWCESTDNYQAANPSSSARGAYQFLSGSWRAYGHADRYGVSTASQATPAQQDEAALLTWERDGTRPWNASKSCWSSRI